MTQLGQYGLFDTVLSGPPATSYWLSWPLLGLCTAIRIALAHWKKATNQDPQFNIIIYELALAAAALGAYSYLAQWIWAAGQNLAVAIYPESKMEALGELLLQVSGRFRDYSFSFFDVAKGAKDGAVVAVGFLSWLFALLGHAQLQGAQAVVWNCLYCFGPLLLAASMLGIPSGRVWLSCLIQVSCWSVATAVVYRTIGDSLAVYLLEAKDLPLLDTRFIDVITNLIFLAVLPLMVPGLVAYFVGQSVAPIFSAATSQQVATGVAGAVGSFIGGRLGSSAHQPPASAGGKHKADAHEDGHSLRPKDV